ncbi:hypothetical protein XENTR_v10016916 [Xenopus tropicalis]|nr:hypothetical protein XENTR_v10016916 [Xenopus tropicalis]
MFTIDSMGHGIPKNWSVFYPITVSMPHAGKWKVTKKFYNHIKSHHIKVTLKIILFLGGGHNIMKRWIAKETKGSFTIVTQMYTDVAHITPY